MTTGASEVIALKARKTFYSFYMEGGKVTDQGFSSLATKRSRKTTQPKLLAFTASGIRNKSGYYRRNEVVIDEGSDILRPIFTDLYRIPPVFCAAESALAEWKTVPVDRYSPLGKFDAAAFEGGWLGANGAT